MAQNGEQVNDGGPAFPVFPDGETGHAAAFRGMSLRDYFAGQALAGLAEFSRFAMHDRARLAYEYADAMLAAHDSTPLTAPDLWKAAQEGIGG